MGLACNDNPYLTSLNIQNGKNSEWAVFSATNTPLLDCIMVDYVPHANGAWTVADGEIDPHHYFSTNCPPPTAIEEHTTYKELLKVTDLLARETKETKNVPLFYIYDDGTVEKRIIIK